ncbi:MAG: response regulator transcription factor [Actinomycetales bacterium]|nr:response regulator transcription factor [Actinomycetales bacterium]
MEEQQAAVSVAVIDDHELVRQGLASLLAGTVVAGRQVEVVYAGGSVQAGVDARPDIGLLDVDLGPGSAPVDEAVGQLLEAGSRVLMISAYDDARSIKAGLGAGALGFVPKRVSLDALVEALSTVYTNELYLSVDLASILAAAVDTPDLSRRESEALKLYASGLSMSAVARRLEISPHTAKEYLDRVRAKYAALGREARTRTELYAAAQSDGLLEERRQS